MINSIIRFSINNKLIVGLFTLVLIFAGIYSMTKVPIDAVPDITNNQVQIITQAPNLSTEDIEQFVTYPVELAVANLPDVTEIRSVSRFGLSVVTIVFKDEVGTFLPRQLVSEKLNEIKANIPEGFGEPFMGPISTGLGEIYQYTLEVAPEYKDAYSLTELRTVQDWIIKRQMAMVPGVVEVNAFGGSAKQYQVAINPNQLKSLNLTIGSIFEALKNNNENTGGAYIEKKHQAFFIRGDGLARSIEDIESIVVTQRDGIPITISDIATVSFGSATRYGALTKNGEGEAVGGMILMLKGANTNKVIADVKERISEIEASLPKGITIASFIDRTELITNTTHTVQKNLIEGALIVLFILVFFLGNWRGGLIVASTIPLSLLFAFIMMNVFDVWANLMSLGAIDFGIIIDGAVIIVESTVFLLFQRTQKGKSLSSKSKNKIAFKASSKMMNTAFFGQLIILIVFLPILALEGIEGKMFKPMALTFIFAMIGAMVLCLTYVPMVSSLFIKVPANQKPSWGDKVVFAIENKYSQLLQILMPKGKTVIALAFIALVAAIIGFSKMGGEFIPQLDEGDIAFHGILKPGSSLSESIATTTKIEKIVKENFPEAIDVISRIGVADVPTDPMPMDISDIFITLRPKEEWTSAKTKEELIEKIKEKLLQVPGVNYEFTQPIEMRFNELITGVREDIAIKLYGDDLDVLAQKAEEIGKAVAPIQGVADFKVEATTGQPQITIAYNRSKIAQYGLQINALNKTIETAFAGGKAGTIFEGEKRFDLVVRLQENLRQDVNHVKNIFIDLPNGTQIPLKEVATISFQPGPMQISRDNTQRRTYVGINVRGRDVKSLVEEIKENIKAKVDLPVGYFIRYGGAFENLERATSKLKIVVPLALGLIFIFIYFALKSVKQTFMIYMAIPFAAIGGVFALMLRDMPFSISAGIGFIVLFGVAVLNGLVLISSFNELKSEGVIDMNKRIFLGTKRRVRPILLTALTDIFGFLPMALSSSAGAEVQKPLATVVIGGLITATLLTLVVLPILYKWFENKNKISLTPMQKPAIAIVLLSLFCMPSANAQEIEVTMETAVEIALNNYPDIKAASLEVDRQKAIKAMSWDLGTTNVFTSGEEIGDNEGTYTRLGIGQKNIDLFGIAPKNKVANENIAMAESGIALTQLQVTKETQKAWIEAFIAKKKFESYEEIEQIFSDLSTALALQYETQDISKLEYKSTENEGKLVSLEKKKAMLAYSTAKQRLQVWMYSDTIFAIKDVDIASFSEIDNSSNSVSIKNHPSYTYLDNKLGVETAKIKVYQSNYLPKFSAQYGFQEVEGVSGFSTFQVGMQFPLIFAKAKGSVQAQKLNVSIMEEEIKAQKSNIEVAFNTLKKEYEMAQQEWEYYSTEALPLAKQQRLGALVSYEEGALDYVVFLQSIKEAIELEIETWDVLKKYVTKKIELEYYLQQITN